MWEGIREELLLSRRGKYKQRTMNRGKSYQKLVHSGCTSHVEGPPLGVDEVTEGEEVVLGLEVVQKRNLVLLMELPIADGIQNLLQGGRIT